MKGDVKGAIARQGGIDDKLSQIDTRLNLPDLREIVVQPIDGEYDKRDRSTRF